MSTKQISPSLLWSKIGVFFLLLRSLTRKKTSFDSLLVFRARDEAGGKKTKRSSVPLVLPELPLPLARPHSRWQPAKWCNDASSAGLVAKETRKPEMRIRGWAKAVGGRPGVSGPDREERRAGPGRKDLWWQRLVSCAGGSSGMESQITEAASGKAERASGEGPGSGGAVPGTAVSAPLGAARWKLLRQVRESLLISPLPRTTLLACTGRATRQLLYPGQFCHVLPE